MFGGSLMKYLAVALFTVLITTNVATGISTYRLKSEIRSLNEDKTSLSEEVRRLTTEKELLTGELGRRSEIIESLRTFFKDYDSAAAQKQAEIAAALQKVAEVVRQTNLRSQKILADMPQSDDVCSEANRLVNEYLKEVYGIE